MHHVTQCTKFSIADVRPEAHFYNFPKNFIPYYFCRRLTWCTVALSVKELSILEEMQFALRRLSLKKLFYYLCNFRYRICGP